MDNWVDSLLIRSLHLFHVWSNLTTAKRNQKWSVQCNWILPTAVIIARFGFVRCLSAFWKDSNWDWKAGCGMQSGEACQWLRSAIQTTFHGSDLCMEQWSILHWSHQALRHLRSKQYVLFSAFENSHRDPLSESFDRCIVFLWNWKLLSNWLDNWNFKRRYTPLKIWSKEMSSLQHHSIYDTTVHLNLRHEACRSVSNDF